MTLTVFLRLESTEIINNQNLFDSKKQLTLNSLFLLTIYFRVFLKHVDQNHINVKMDFVLMEIRNVMDDLIALMEKMS